MENEKTELSRKEMILGSKAKGVFAVETDMRITFFNKELTSHPEEGRGRGKNDQ